jgi:predicted ATP-binding protein involved in virulence
MKKLLLKEILLLSKKEGKAKKIRFDPDTTVVTGLNNTGKSSLIKSIYHCLGADVDYHPKWKGANVTCLLKFELDDKDYNILRHQNLFGVLYASLYEAPVTTKYSEMGSISHLIVFHTILED